MAARAFDAVEAGDTVGQKLANSTGTEAIVRAAPTRTARAVQTPSRTGRAPFAGVAFRPEASQV